MNLIIDQGNTNIKFVIFCKDKIIDIKNYKEDKKKNNYICNFVSEIFLEHRINKAIYSSVAGYNKELVDSLKEAILFKKDGTNKEIKNIYFLDEKILLPIKNLYETPKTLGNDRIAAAIGANYLFPKKNVLIIDIGTAITYDFVNNKAEYVGGNISPGIDIRFKALNKYTKKLPLLKKEKKDCDFGRNTKNAIIFGVQKGIFHEINGYIVDFQEKYENSKIIFTGGDTFFFDKLLKRYIFAEPNLVSIGLNRILKYNEQTT